MHNFHLQAVRKHLKKAEEYHEKEGAEIGKAVEIINDPTPSPKPGTEAKKGKIKGHGLFSTKEGAEKRKGEIPGAYIKEVKVKGKIRYGVYK